MFTVIGLMLGGMCIGFLLRKSRFTWIHNVITALYPGSHPRKLHLRLGFVVPII